MTLINSFVNECFMYCGTLDTAYDNYSKYFHQTKLQGESVEDFFVRVKPDILRRLWNQTYSKDVNQYSSKVYHYNKMSITKYLAQPLDKIGKDKTFYFLGKRHTKVKDLTRIADHFGWTWEKKDHTKADFIILGDNPECLEASYVWDGIKPIVMDDELRVQLHFLFNEDVNIDDIDNEFVSVYLNSNTYDSLKLVVVMIQYLQDNILSDSNKLRLIRSYVSTFSDIKFELSNSEHVWMSDTVQRHCHPQHRYLVTNHFLGSRKVAKDRWGRRDPLPDLWQISNQEITLGKALVWNDIYCYVPGTTDSRYLRIIHSCEGEDEVLESDIVSNNSYSPVPRYVYSKQNEYVLTNEVTEVIDGLGKYIITISNEFRVNLWFTKGLNSKADLLNVSLLSTYGNLLSRKELITTYGSNSESLIEALTKIGTDLSKSLHFSDEGKFGKKDEKDKLLSYYIDIDSIVTKSRVDFSRLMGIKLSNRVNAANSI